MGKRGKFQGQDHALATEGKEIRERRWYQKTGTIFSISFFSFAFVISVALVVFTIVFFFNRVEGPSMMATLNPNCPTPTCIMGGVNFNTDAVIVNRHATPRRGDVIIVQDPRPGRSGTFIKRLIATGGDTVYFRRVPLLDENGNQFGLGPGGIYRYRFLIEVNGNQINEYYLDHDHWGMNLLYGVYAALWNLMNAPDGSPRRPVCGLGVNPNCRFINWVDGRYNSSGEYIPGRFEIHVPAGYLWYMGDNRGGRAGSDASFKSLDGSGLGPQPRDHLVGVVVDVVPNNQSLPGWIWRRFVWFITFRWI